MSPELKPGGNRNHFREQVIGGIAAQVVTNEVEITGNPEATLLEDIQKDHPEIETRDYQLDCLNTLALCRAAGDKKALIHMATGLGKTTVVAADARRYLHENPGSRVLFLCHQNQILQQARERFESVLGTDDYTFGDFTGVSKDMHEVTCLFASFQTMKDWREYFGPDEFDYIVVDESHHAKAETYEPTLKYFNPKFLLGLTATPDRQDLKEIREIFGHEKYSKNLAEALADGLLAKPDYRVILDDIQQDILKGVLERENVSLAEINRTIFIPKRDEEIVRIILERTADLARPKSIVFCPSIDHARRIADLLPNSTTFHSGMKKYERDEALEAFKSDLIDSLVSVDMFNEGMDIPDANSIIFLRSTQSETIFLQQLGRGLRKLPDKDSVLVLDFVANCDRLIMVEKLLHNTVASSTLQREIEQIAPPALIETEEGKDPIEEIDIYSLSFNEVAEDLAKARELGIGNFEFTETTRKILDLINRIQRDAIRYKDWGAENSIAYYRNLSNELGRAANLDDIRLRNSQSDGPSKYILLKNFEGRITDLKDAAGFTWTNQDSIEYYRTLSEEVGHEATPGDVIKASKDGKGPSMNLLTRDFNGRIIDLKNAAGFESLPKPDWSHWKPDDSICYYQELSEKLGRPATINDIRDASKNRQGPSAPTLLEGFEQKLGKLKKAAGYEVTARGRGDEWTEEESLAYYSNLCEELGRIATVRDIDDASKASKGPSINLLTRDFGGSIINLRAAAEKQR